MALRALPSVTSQFLLKTFEGIGVFVAGVVDEVKRGEFDGEDVFAVG